RIGDGLELHHPYSGVGQTRVGVHEDCKDDVAISIDPEHQPVAVRGIGEKADRAAVEGGEAGGDARSGPPKDGQGVAVTVDEPEAGDCAAVSVYRNEVVGTPGNARRRGECRVETQSTVAGAIEQAIVEGRCQRQQRAQGYVVVVVVFTANRDAAGLQSGGLVKSSGAIDGDGGHNRSPTGT